MFVFRFFNWHSTTMETNKKLPSYVHLFQLNGGHHFDHQNICNIKHFDLLLSRRYKESSCNKSIINNEFLPAGLKVKNC